MGGLNLIEANGVETKTEVEKSNGNAIKHAKEHHSPQIYELGLEQVHPLRHVEGAERHHQMPARQCCGCNHK